MTYLVNKNPPPRAPWFDTAASFFLGAAAGFFVGVVAAVYVAVEVL